jgi:hypothetical protein
MGSVNTDERLSQHFDGELPAEDGEALAEELANDAALRAKLEGLSQLRKLIVAATDERGDEVDSDALWARIEAGLSSDVVDEDPMLPGALGLPAGPVQPALLGSEVEKRGAALELVPGGKKSSDAKAAPKRRNVVWIGMAASLAVAAAVLLFVFRPSSIFPTDGGTPTPMAVAPPPGSEVVEVDFGYSTGAIFSVEGGQGEHIAVVWISDEKASVDEAGDERIQ